MGTQGHGRWGHGDPLGLHQHRSPSTQGSFATQAGLEEPRAPQQCPASPSQAPLAPPILTAGTGRAAS